LSPPTYLSLFLLLTNNTIAPKEEATKDKLLSGITELAEFYQEIVTVLESFLKE
jgi:hypothetical protein